eukprot:4338958-Pyramimonas_sp.AAC.1
MATPSPVTPSAPPSVGKVESEMVCTKCKKPVTLSNSKPTGRNPLYRIGNDCATNKRNMERKVAKRESTDALKVWWKKLQKNPVEEEAWYVKMAAKSPHSTFSDEEIMQVTEQ